MKFDRSEFGERLGQCGNARYHEFLRAPNQMVAAYVARQVKIPLHPDTDRVDRNGDLSELFIERPILPKGIDGGMLHDVVDQVVGNISRLNAVSRKLVGKPHRPVPPNLRKIALDAAGIDPTAIKIHVPVIGRNAGQVRRAFRGHTPLGR